MNKVKLGEILKIKHGFAFKSETMLMRASMHLSHLRIFHQQITSNSTKIRQHFMGLHFQMTLS